MHVRRVQVPVPASAPPPEPHTLGLPPPPQVWPEAHVPHWSTPPQPSATGPQLAPTLPHVRGVQALPLPGVPHTLGLPPPPQV
jgi:hypothetical protein